MCVNKKSVCGRSQCATASLALRGPRFPLERSHSIRSPVTGTNGKDALLAELVSQSGFGEQSHKLVFIEPGRASTKNVAQPGQLVPTAAAPVENHIVGLISEGSDLVVRSSTSEVLSCWGVIMFREKVIITILGRLRRKTLLLQFSYCSTTCLR